MAANSIGVDLPSLPEIEQEIARLREARLLRAVREAIKRKQDYEQASGAICRLNKDVR